MNVNVNVDEPECVPDNGYIEGKELDAFFRHLLMKLGPGVRLTPTF